MQSFLVVSIQHIGVWSGKDLDDVVEGVTEVERLLH